MHIFKMIMRSNSRKPATEHAGTDRLRATCHRCYYWSGKIGMTPSELMCAVNVPKPTEAELDTVDYHRAYTFHDCPDFKEYPMTAPPSQ